MGEKGLEMHEIPCEHCTNMILVESHIQGPLVCGECQANERLPIPTGIDELVAKFHELIEEKVRLRLERDCLVDALVQMQTNSKGRENPAWVQTTASVALAKARVIREC